MLKQLYCVEWILSNSVYENNATDGHTYFKDHWKHNKTGKAQHVIPYFL